jgi:uncharacterized membrane protein YebE (DUF533 family)
MLDPKVLLDALLAGAAKPTAAQQSNAAPANAVDLGEILRRMGQAGGQAGGPGQQQGGGGLQDILEKLGRAAGQQGQGSPQQGGGGPGGGLGDILGEIFGRGGQSGSPPGGAPSGGAPYETGGRMGQPQGGQGSGGSGGDLLEEIFGPQKGQPPSQAPSRQAQQPSPQPQQRPWGDAGGSGRGGAIDVRQRAEELLSAIAAGQGTPEMIEELQQMVARGQINAGAVIGGLGSLVVGSKPGRRINADAARLGGLELIGAIAYNGYVGYKQGRNPSAGQPMPTGPAPNGSGFEPEAQTSDTALLYVRAMIAAAVADGQVDRAEQQQIVGGLERLGLGQNASQFLQQEFENPQSVEALIQATGGAPAIALQVYAAARLAIEPDTRDEQAFLQSLAQGIGIDAGLAAHIDAQTTSLKV